MGAKVLSERSKKNLVNVHPDLIKIIEKCLSYGTVDFSVIQGQRSIEQHLQNLARGVRAAKELGIPARSGGDWNMDENFRNDRFYDGGHFELIQPYNKPTPVIPTVPTKGGSK